MMIERGDTINKYKKLVPQDNTQVLKHTPLQRACNYYCNIGLCIQRAASGIVKWAPPLVSGVDVSASRLFLHPPTIHVVLHDSSRLFRSGAGTAVEHSQEAYSLKYDTPPCEDVSGCPDAYERMFARCVPALYVVLPLISTLHNLQMAAAT